MSEIAGLTVVFDGDVSKLDIAAKQAGSTLDKVDDKAVSASESIKELEGAASKAGGSFNGVKTGAESASDGLSGLGDAANNTGNKVKQLPSVSRTASNAVLNLGRIAQDSSFGFIGIANNIEPFIQSLTSLKSTAGTAQTAFSSFFSALAGPAGIGVLIGAISLIDAYSKGYGIFSNKVKEADKAQKDAFKTAKEFAFTEINNAKLLASIAQDITRPMRERVKAVDELQQKYPDYLGNLKKEAILTGNAAGSINELSKALLNKALAQAAGENIGKLTQQLDEANDVLDKAQKKAIKQTENFKKSISRPDGKISDSDFSLITQELERINAPVNKAQKEVESLTKKIDEAFQRQRGYAKLAGDLFFETSTSTSKSTEKVEKQTVAVSKLNDEYEKFREQLEKLSLGSIVKISGKSFGNATEEIIKANVPNLNIPAKILLPPPDEVAQQLKSFRDAVEVTSTNLFTSVADAIGSGKGIKGAFSAILQTLGEGFKTVGRAMIAAAPLIQALKNIFKANPAAGLIAGVAFVSLGSFLQSQIPKLARGGIVTGPTNAIIGESGPEAVIPLGKIPSLFSGGRQTYEFVIQGNALKGVLAKANTRASIIG